MKLGQDIFCPKIIRPHTPLVTPPVPTDKQDERERERQALRPNQFPSGNESSPDSRATAYRSWRPVSGIRTSGPTSSQPRSERQNFANSPDCNELTGSHLGPTVQGIASLAATVLHRSITQRFSISDLLRWKVQRSPLP